MTGIPVAPGELVDNTCINEWARVHWRKLTTKTVVNSTAETDLLNGEVTSDAGAMSTNRTLRLVAKMGALNNAGSTIALPRWRLKLGGVTLLDTGAPAAGWGASSTRTVWKATAEITNLGATNAQAAELDLNGLGVFSAVDGFFATGAGKYGTGGSSSLLARALGINTSLTIDTTAALALQLTVQLPTANAQVNAELYDAYVELI